MIGTSILATEVTLPGLRNLRSWSALADKLPSATSGLLNTTDVKPQARLTRPEWKVWAFSDGTAPLTEIAQRLELSLEAIQRIAFRLTVAGLAEEVPLATLTSTGDKEAALTSPELTDAPSSEILNQMISFLKKQPQS